MFVLGLFVLRDIWWDVFVLGLFVLSPGLRNVPDFFSVFVTIPNLICSHRTYSSERKIKSWQLKLTMPKGKINLGN